MTVYRCLLAAEADQIQDFIFRAARLREVVGGSQLLTRFCGEGVPALLKHPRYGGDPEADIVISDGGAFRLVFAGVDEQEAEAKAEAFGRDLAELYRRAAGGTLTVAPPVSFVGDEDFKRASHEAQNLLRRAKREGDAPAAAAHLPYIAFCASCGLSLAAAYLKKVAVADARANYLCSDCERKDAEQRQHKLYEQRQQPRGFVEDFRGAVRACLEDQKEMPPDEARRLSLNSPEKGDWPEAIGKLDPRRYVAYLIADGNDMGRLFGDCNRDQMRALSKILTETLRASLAAPCATLLTRQEKVRKEQTLPILPLILGGDDLFALMPAPWAIDLAARFCREYERRLGDELQETKLFDAQRRPTIAAAVVICKSTYPHTLAHNLAGRALREAKELARRLEIEGVERGSSYRASVLNFTIVTGGKVGGDEATYRAQLRPYFIGDEAPAEWGVSVERLLDARHTLRSLPGKRRGELEQLYVMPPAKPDEDEDLKERWLPELNALLARVGRGGSKLRRALEEVLSQLGEAEADGGRGFWKRVRRAQVCEWRGNGLPDLLEAWDFAFRADKQASEYEGERDAA